MSAATLQLSSLFDQIQEDFPTSFSAHGWYTLTASALMTVSNPANIRYLYSYLISLPQWSSHEQRRALSRRLREQMLKQWVIIGIPKVITAVRALATIEAPEDADSSLTREGVSLTPEMRKRGRELCYSIYGQEKFEDIMSSWGSMRGDISWTADNIIYGMFLAEESVLNRQETTLMSYSSMACMDLLGTSRRHLVGLLRHGASEDECARIIKCTKSVAQWAGRDTSDWVTIHELQAEPQGREMHDQIMKGRI